MSASLTVLNSAPLALHQGGFGIDFDSDLFRLKPATLNIIQQNSQVEGKRGALRISETGEQFSELDVTLLETPRQSRSLYAGEAGQMNKSPDNLLCFSRDLITPDSRAKQPQALQCATCSNADWGPWNDFKDANNGVPNKALAPGCEKLWYAVLMSTKTKIPLQAYIRGKSVKPFAASMKNVSRLFAMAIAEGQRPNIYDVRFTLKTKQVVTGKYVSYVYDLSNFQFITAEERESFGAVYLKYVAQKQKQAQESQQSQQNRQSEPSTEEYLDEEINI